MDLSVVYSKTPKGLRARASLIGGLSSELMKVLTHVDGSAKAETILLKFDHLTPQQLSADITKLVQEGYIRLATVTAASDGGWALTNNFAPMVVEEYQSEEELEATTQAKIQEQARSAAEQQAKQEQEVVKQEQEARLAAEQKINKKAEKLRAKEKSKAESKVKAQLAEEQRVATAAEAAARELAKETELAAKLAEEVAQKKAEAEAKLIAEQAKIKAQIEAERVAKLEEEARQKAELKAREVAEQAQAQAEQQAKEYAHREIDRIAKEAENAQRKQAVENKAKLEAERLEALHVADAKATQEKARLQAEQERIEAEHKLIEEAEQEKIRVETAVKAEADAKQKEKLEQAAKTQAKESAMLEIASIVRKAEEDRKKAAAKAKEEKLEAKRKAKADKDAADKARHEVLQLAEEAERTEKKLAESIRVNAEESVKQQAENQALEKSKQERQEYKYQQAADGIRAKAEAEEQAQIEAKENARLEMERIGHEAEAVRQKQLVEQYQAEHKKSLPKLDDFDAAEAAEEAIFEAEERAVEAEKKVARDVDKTALQAKEDADRAEIKQTAKADAARKQKLLASNQSHHSAKYVKKFTLMLAKLVLVYLPVVLLLVVGLLHFVNISMLIAPIEKVATETVGVPVTVTKVHASVWPQPHLVLEGVTMDTASGNQKIEAIHVLPVVSSLFEDVKIVKSLVIEGLNVQQDNFGQALTWIDKVGTAKNLKLEQVNLKNLTFNIQDLSLEPFDGQLIFTELHVLKNIDLVSSSNALFVMISPQAGSYDISLKAANWPLPFNPKVIFNALDAKGTISQNQIEFSQITGEMYGGNLAAKAVINLPQNNSQWSTTVSFSLTKADTPLLLTAFNSAVSVDGKLNLNGSFTSQSATANKLAQAANITADFDISQGSIGDIELARAVIARGSQSLAGDATDFDRLTGTVKINQGQYQYAKLALASQQFHANGYLNISANEIVSGKINADLAAQSRRLQANFTVTGRGKDLKSN